MTRTQGAITAKAALQLQGVLPTAPCACRWWPPPTPRSSAAADLAESGLL